MEAEQVESNLIDTLLYADKFDELISMVSFENGGVLTNDRGITIRYEDGSEFQITIVKTR